MRSLLAVFAVFLLASPAIAADKPSFVLFVTDDQRADCLSCAGHPLLKTPNIDAIAKSGTRFTNGFVTTSICCISRASIMSGRLARHHKVPDFRTAFTNEVMATTFPALLKKNGYRVGILGKWGVGGTPPKEHFDFWDAWGGQGNFFHDVNGEKVHNSEYLARQAVKFIADTPANTPFCLIVLYKSPHEPYQPDPRDAGLFKDTKITPPKTADEKYFKELPEFLKTSLNRVRAVRDFPTADKYQEFVKQYFRCIAGVDRSVGIITKELADKKRADSTVVVYTSDNGFFLGERGFNHKWLMYEESIRVPLIVADPRIPKAQRGVKRNELVLNIDIAPTILHLAGVEIPKEMDGVRLTRLLGSEPVKWRSHFFYEHHYFHSKDPKNHIPRTEGIRTDRWKYITYTDHPEYVELFDLHNDPLEEKNLAPDPKHKDALAEMKALYEKEVKRLPPAIPGGNAGKKK
ncbi:MAG: sulfatase [Planctomycetia bacterium]|nr:sulfatase [Planctomycetia bacterium]